MNKDLSLENIHIKNVHKYLDIIEILIELYLKNDINKFNYIRSKLDDKLCDDIILLLKKSTCTANNYLIDISSDLSIKNLIHTHITDFSKLIIIINCIKQNISLSVIDFIKNKIENQNKLLEDIKNIPSPPKNNLPKINIKNNKINNKI